MYCDKNTNICVLCCCIVGGEDQWALLMYLLHSWLCALWYRHSAQVERAEW